jgi:hypothetical protein
MPRPNAEGVECSILAEAHEAPAALLPTNEASQVQEVVQSQRDAPPSAHDEQRQPRSREGAAARQAGAPGRHGLDAQPRVQIDPEGAVSPREETVRRELMWHDDEDTRRRDLTALQHELAGKHELAGIRAGDPADETRDIEGPSVARRPRSAPATDASVGDGGLTDDATHWRGSLPSDASGADHPGEQTLPLDQCSDGLGKAADDMTVVDTHDAMDMPGCGPDDWSEHGAAADWRAPVPRLPAPQVEPLPAVRVAVIGTSRAGELRLVPLDGRTAPPMGSALGILVPLSTADGRALMRLLKRGG